MILILIGILAFLLSFYFTPMMRQAALRFGVLDHPKGPLKKHKDPVPYLGGMAVYLSFLISIALVFEFSQQVLAILLAGTIVMTLGLFDDFRVLTPKVKFLGQILATLVLVKAGIHIKIVFLPLWVSILLSIIWVLTIINATNIIDISDGLASSVISVIAGCLAFISYINGNHPVAVLAVAIMGSLLGFLPFNWQPAKIYLGDTGSMFIGLIIGALSMVGQYTPLHAWSLLAPLAILFVPLFDLVFVMFCRLIQGKSMFLGSEDHFAVRLRVHGFSAFSIMFISLAVTTVMAVLGVLGMYSSKQYSLIIYGSIGCCVFIFAVILYFRYPMNKEGK